MSNLARLPAAIVAGLLALTLAAGCGPAGTAGVNAPSTTSAPASASAANSADTGPAAAGAPTSAAPVAAPATTTAAPAKVIAPTTAGTVSCRSDEYRNSSGHCVPRPTQAPAPPAGASAICNDGSYSFSEHRRGTCSSHQGVRTWLKDLPA